MRIPWLFAIICATLIVGCALTADAQLQLTFTPDTQETLPGGTVDFTGTLVNTSSSEVFLNGDSINLTGSDFLIDDSPFLNNAPLSLTATGTPDSSYTGLLLTIDTTTEDPGLYFGSFVVTGGATDLSSDNVGSQIFGIDILSSAPAVPEPGTYAFLVSLGLAGTVFLRRRSRTSRR